MQKLPSFLTAAQAIALLGMVLGSPAWAQIRQITHINTTPTDDGLTIDLEAEQAAQATVLQTYFGNTAIVDLTVTQLVEGSAFYQDDPIEGIDLISVEPLDANSVRIRIVGTIGAPIVSIDKEDAEISLNVVPARRSSISCRRCSVPNYPRSALEAGIEGTPVVNIMFDADGNVTDVVLKQSSGNPALDQAVLEAARSFEFDTTGQGGQVTVEVPFVIEGSRRHREGQ